MIIERLFTKAYFDLPIYSNDVEKRRDFGVIERDIAAAYPDRRYIPIQTSDVRFDDSSFGRIHACATERLILWALKPSTSNFHREMQYLGCPLIRPITAIFDAGANTALLALKVCSLNFNHNTTLLANETGRAYVRMLLSLLAVLSVVDLWRGPSPTLHNTFSWVYKIQNYTDGSAITLLDQRKARFLKEKCGWQHLADNALRAAAPRNDIFHQGYALHHGSSS